MKDLIIYLIKVPIVYALGLVAMVVLALPVIVASTIVSHLAKPEIHEVTSPLEAAVVQDLCQKLALSEDDPLCQPGAIVYAPDFFPVIRASFERGVTTYDDVQEKLGNYQYECESPVTLADGTMYFRCGYDLKGDRVFPVGFSFTSEGILERIFATVGDD